MLRRGCDSVDVAGDDVRGLNVDGGELRPAVDGTSTLDGAGVNTLGFPRLLDDVEPATVPVVGLGPADGFTPFGLEVSAGLELLPMGVDLT